MRTVLLIAAAVLLSGCPAKPQQLQGDDHQMFLAAKQVALAINGYHSDTAEWPETIEQAAPYLEPGASWPANPYNGAALSDTASPEFDPQSSPGNVCYEKFYRNGQLCNYQLHVFGEHGTIYIFGNSAFGAKQR